MGYLVECLHYIERPFRKYTKTEHSYTLLPITYVDLKTPSIDFECIRYVYDSTNSTFSPYEFTLGSNTYELFFHSEGLKTAEADKRLALNGPNEILFEMHSLKWMIFVEFTGIYYLYQFMILLIWWYFAYYYMAFVLTSVILGSGFIKVLVSQEQQKKVIQMATVRDHMRVLRDGEWINRDTRQLCPGKDNILTHK